MSDPVIVPVERTTQIDVFDEVWHVPRGFGAVYRRTAMNHLCNGTSDRISEVIDLLALIGYRATVEQVASWDLRKRVEAVVYAATVHARASDNPVRRHPRLSWLPERAWQGPDQGEGAFAGPSGTPLVGGG